MRFSLVSLCKMETKMGTYTTNYNLFMPSIGEQGWGELVNGNFATIDTAMSGLNTRVGILETETAAVEERVTTLEAGEFSGNVSAETFDGNLCVDVTSDANYTIGTYTVTPYALSNSTTYSYRYKGSYGNVSITIKDVVTSFKKGFTQNEVTPLKITAKITATVGNTSSAVFMARLYKNDTQIATSSYTVTNPSCTATVYVLPNDVISGDFYMNDSISISINGTNTLTLSNLTGSLYIA